MNDFENEFLNSLNSLISSFSGAPVFCLNVLVASIPFGIFLVIFM